MIEINVEQGSDAWMAHRAKYRNASDTPAVTGSSEYKSRSDFLKERATGVIPEVDSATQRRFDDGHRFEALARPLMEKIIGEDLFPVVGVEGLYSASFDGLTMMGDTNAEHKTMNDAIRACETAADLPLMYREQMEHQMMVSGAGRSLFMATRWSGEEGSEVLEEQKHFWYEPDLKLRKKICAAWDQFEIDVASYVPAEVIPAAVAAPTLDLPVVSIQTSGAIAIRSNLRAFGEALNAFIERLPAKPSTDQEFADCKAALSKLKTAEETLESEESRALSQMTEIDEMRREKKLYQDLARSTRLALEKLVAARESAIKVEIVSAGKAALAEHISSLNKRLGKPYMPTVAENFSGVIKNKRTVASLQGAVDDELARCKIAANETADRIQVNLNSLRELAAEHAFLFSDAAQIVLKANDDLVILIKSRIAEHKADQERKLEAERARIRKEEQDRADREAAARIEAERKEQERIRAEEEAKAKVEAAEKVRAEQKVLQQGSSTSAPTLGEVLHTSAPTPIAEASAPTKIETTTVAEPKGDLAWTIAGLLSEMTDAEKTLVLHYCERLIAQRNKAA
jgi:predicted phage-related endonuclease